MALLFAGALDEKILAEARQEEHVMQRVGSALDEIIELMRAETWCTFMILIKHYTRTGGHYLGSGSTFLAESLKKLGEILRT